MSMCPILPSCRMSVEIVREGEEKKRHFMNNDGEHSFASGQKGVARRDSTGERGEDVV